MNNCGAILKIAFRAACTLLCAGLLLSNQGCKQVFGGGTITIKGKLVQDCSGTPIAGAPIEFTLKAYSSAITGEGGSIGVDTTDQDGNFSITGMNFGSGSLKLLYYSGSAVCGIEGIDGSTVDLGTVYNKVDMSYGIKFHRSASNYDDTLYYGNSVNNPVGTVVGKAINEHIYYTNFQRDGFQLPYRVDANWAWGIGMAEYKRAVDSLNVEPKDHHFKVWPGICKDDTVFVNLPG